VGVDQAAAVAVLPVLFAMLWRGGLAADLDARGIMPSS
jgi:hypothetical protein